MAVIAVFWAFLAPFVALIAGLALVTFSPLKQGARPKKLVLIGLFVGGITALGWAPVLLSSSIGFWPFLCVLVICSFYETLVILFVSGEVLAEKMANEGADGFLRQHSIF
jgi:hypothetical protein